jgi:hypothetical protein
MPTILDLFKNKKLDGGQTAEKKYDIRNPKDEKLSTYSGAIDIIASPVNLLRRNLSIRTKETRLEQELVGVRAIRGLASPILYGTDIIRLKTKTTSIKDSMVNAARGGDAPASEGGLVGKALDKLTGGKVKSVDDVKNKVTQKALEITSKLGIAFPETMIPTKVALNSKFIAGSEPNTMITLAEIKKDAAGNFAGKLLKQSFKGTPNQIGNAILGNGIELAKKELKKLLLGGPKQGQQLLAKKIDSEVPYDSKSKYSATVSPQSEILLRNDLSSILEQKRLTAEFNKNDAQVKDLLKNPPTIDEAPLNADNNPFASVKDKLKAGKEKAKESLSAAKKQGQQILAKTKKGETPKNDDGTAVKKSDTVDPSADDPKLRNDLSTIYNNSTISKQIKSRYSLKDDIQAKNVEVLKGIKPGSDFLNSKVAYQSNNGENLKLDNNTYLDDYDFVPLKFYSVAKGAAVNFRATINSINEQFTPSWNDNKTIGNPFNFYTYSGIERTVSIEFKVFSLNAREHVAAWQRLSFLASLVYPQGYSGGPLATIAPFLKLTIGNWYKNKEGFIEQLSFSTDENTTWEVGLTEGLQEFKLPQVINVNLSFKFVESVGTTEVFGKVKVKGADGKETEVTRPVSKARIFGYGEAPTQVENKEDKQKKLDASGTPKPKEETPVNQQSATPTKEENPAKQAMKPEEPDTFKKVHTTPEAGNKFYIYSKKDAYGLYIATAYEKEDKKGYVTNIMGKTEDKAVQNLIETLDFRNDFVPDGGNEPSISTLKTLKANRGK